MGLCSQERSSSISSSAVEATRSASAAWPHSADLPRDAPTWPHNSEPSATCWPAS